MGNFGLFRVMSCNAHKSNLVETTRVFLTAAFTLFWSTYLSIAKTE